MQCRVGEDHVCPPATKHFLCCSTVNSITVLQATDVKVVLEVRLMEPPQPVCLTPPFLPFRATCASLHAQLTLT